jgi:hypothetical protein
VDIFNVLSHDDIQNLAENNAMLDPVKENNKNQGHEEEQENDAVDTLPEHECDTPANLNALPTMEFRSILYSTKASRKKRVHNNEETDSHSTSQILEMTKLDKQLQKRHLEEDIKYLCIQVEEIYTQAEKIPRGATQSGLQDQRRQCIDSAVLSNDPAIAGRSHQLVALGKMEWQISEGR